MLQSSRRLSGIAPPAPPDFDQRRLELLNGHTAAFDDVGPFRDLGLDERRDLGKRQVKRFAGGRRDALLYDRLGERFFDLAVQLLDDRLRRLFRRPESEPHIILVIRYAGFGDRRHVRQERRALRAGNRECADIAALDLAQRARKIVEACPDMTSA